MKKRDEVPKISSDTNIPKEDVSPWDDQFIHSSDEFRIVLENPVPEQIRKSCTVQTILIKDD
jgi:hypothetical protein